jgi:hypothetical protein
VTLHFSFVKRLTSLIDEAPHLGGTFSILPLMRNSSQVYTRPKLLDMTPFTYLTPWSQQPSLNKKVCLSRYEKQHLGLPNPSPKLHLKYVSGVMTSRVGHTTNQPFGMRLRHAHVPASSPCLPPLSGSSFLNPKLGVRF